VGALGGTIEQYGRRLQLDHLPRNRVVGGFSIGGLRLRPAHRPLGDFGDREDCGPADRRGHADPDCHYPPAGVSQQSGGRRSAGARARGARGRPARRRRAR